MISKLAVDYDEMNIGICSINEKELMFSTCAGLL